MSEEKKSETAAEKLARLEHEREERAKARAETKKDAEVEKLLAAEEAYAKLEEKHGPDNLRMTKTVCGPVIMRSPTDVQRRNFRKAQQTGVDQRAEAGKVLVTACVVHPDCDTFATYVKEKPFIVDVLLEDLVEDRRSRRRPKTLSEQLQAELHQARTDLYTAGLALAALFRGDDSDAADLGGILLAEAVSLWRQKATQQPASSAAARSRFR